MHSLARLKALLSRILFARPLLQTMTSSKNCWSAPESLQIYETSKLMLQTLCKPGPSGQCGFHSIHGWPTLVFSKVHTVASVSPSSRCAGKVNKEVSLSLLLPSTRSFTSLLSNMNSVNGAKMQRKRGTIYFDVSTIRPTFPCNSTPQHKRRRSATNKSLSQLRQLLFFVTCMICLCEARNQKAVCSRTCFKFRVDASDHMLETPQKLPRTQGTLQSAPRMSS